MYIYIDILLHICVDLMYIDLIVLLFVYINEASQYMTQRNWDYIIHFARETLGFPHLC